VGDIKIMFMKYIITLIVILNFLNIEGIFFLNEDKVYWNRLGNSIGMISSEECVWNTNGNPIECNQFTRKYLEIKQREYEERVY
jgi:hypothetical protein